MASGKHSRLSHLPRLRNTKRKAMGTGRMRPFRATSPVPVADLDKIYEIKKPEFAFDSMAVDLDDEYAVSSYTGLTMDDVAKVDAAIVSEPMMSSQAYSLVLVRVKDKADTASIAQKMADGINPRKWVCVEADDLTVVSKDDIIMLFMADSELSFTSDDAVAAFTESCGKPDQTYQPN